MDYLGDIGAARLAINGFLMTEASALPDDLRETLIEVASEASPVDQICKTAELLYARHSEAGTAGRKLAAQLALFGAGGNQWQGMREGRGEAVAWAMMRRNGYSPPAGVTFQPAADDPAPDARFAPG